MKINHILVDMDPTNDVQPALSRAITLAKSFNASIELLLVVYNSSLMTQWFWNEKKLEDVKQHYLASQKRWLDTYVSEVVNANIPVSIDIKWYKPLYRCIINKAKQCNADLVIKSTHRHPAINKHLFTPNDWQLLKACPTPLLLTKAKTAPIYSHVLAAIDPTHSHGKPEGLDKVILDTTVELSETIGATPAVAHFYKPIEPELWQGIGDHSIYLGYGYSFVDHGDYLKQLREHHQKQFDTILEPYNFSDENKHLQPGAADQLLPEIVEDNDIDLLVLGTTYRTGLLGSTAEKILDKVSCDVMAVKPEGFELLD